MCHECTTFLPCLYISFSGGADRPSHILYMPKASHSLFIPIFIFIFVNVPTSPLCLNVYYHGFGSGSKRVSMLFFRETLTGLGVWKIPPGGGTRTGLAYNTPAAQ